MYLIDTNVISEVRKGVRCDPHVAEWYRRAHDDELFLSVMVIGEIRQGIERLRKRNPGAGDTLEKWLQETLRSFADRLLPVDERVAQAWGRISSKDPLPLVDSLLAATAQVYGLIVVTRNVKDIARSGVRCINPFDPAEHLN